MRAEFWAGRALSVDDRNIDATRLMAEINEAQDWPAALGWRIKVVQREPNNNDDMMLWAKSAFRFGQREMAAHVLKNLPADFQDRSAEYHEMMAGIALGNHDLRGAEEHFGRAAELDRGNPVHRINLASFRLANSPDKEVHARAVKDLHDALADPNARLLAIRELLADATRRHDRENALQLADQLRAMPEHTFADELSCLDIVPTQDRFKAAVADFEKRSEADAQKAIATGEWLNSHRLAPETLRWYPQLPSAVRSSTRMQIVAAEAYLAVGDWQKLEAFLKMGRWEDADFLRRAMAIRARRELAQPWQKDWEQLTDDVEANPPDGFLLAQVVIGWKWRPEAVKLLWDAATKPKTNSVALENLWNLYTETHETRELLRVARAQTELDPANPVRKNNEAFLTLLVYGASSRAERLARAASESNPQIPEWAATYAYALHLAGKDATAQKVMSALPPEALQHPGVALYYAIVLAGNGDQTGARETLARLDARGMLPEERKLATDLAQKLERAAKGASG
ncbi:hypothetical protein CfE428DRAFT_2770 [Chthoniobacter flavus Ellin428]|uniref:Uncharacterized protein n=2 Tax=Chthoniobacter flavus TaxID=191863 RepID=B4D1I2_9BACT|nr:hypothetical protein [Chthoniobacter flavus]EDY19594.1 hypothetical protein CfE428DRAFT_2770 [Chthoniobacter flavus Ellin428]